MEIVSGIDYYPEAKTIFMSATDFYSSNNNISPIPLPSGHQVMPWGEDNDLPQKVIAEVEASEILSANLNFNRDVAYGLGPKLVKTVKDKTGKIVDYLPIESGREFDFFESNDIPMFISSMLTDMLYFHNSFAELIPDNQFKEILLLRHKEAAFSRWSKMNQHGIIDYHFYSAEWPNKTPNKDEYIVTYPVDEFQAVKDIKRMLALRKDSSRRMIFPAYMPSPGRPYYSVPGWHSIFQSGWYDHVKAIPVLKKAIMKNNLGVKFIVYISESYWKNLILSEGIPPDDQAQIRALKAREHKAFQEFLSGEKNAAKAIMAIKDHLVQNNGMTESKQIEIIPIENKFQGGEYIDDLETASAMMSYAMNVHPSLVGATLSKSSGSMSGTDKRELFLIKQATLKPTTERILRILKTVKDVNQWPEDTTIILPEYIFTTQDQNKSGKEESTNQTI